MVLEFEQCGEFIDFTSGVKQNTNYLHYYHYITKGVFFRALAKYIVTG